MHKIARVGCLLLLAPYTAASTTTDYCDLIFSRMIFGQSMSLKVRMGLLPMVDLF